MMKEELSDHESSEPKRIKLDTDVSSKADTSCNKRKHSLLDFSDDVLLIIFSQLSNPKDLFSVSETCTRLNNIIHDKTLWERVDFLSNRITLKALKKFLKFLQPSTKYLAIRGPIDGENEISSIPPTISNNFLQRLAKLAPHLTTLILVDHLIDSSKVKLENFPSSLEHLSLVRCSMIHMATERSYFYGLDNSLPNLKTLDLTGCQWFAPHSLLALSKSKTLESLNLSSCDVSDCLPYASLAANFGFTTLKVLNLSGTRVSDTEVTCFNSVSSLRELIIRDGDGAVTDASITSFGGPPPSILIRYSDALEVVRGRPPSLIKRLEVTGYQGVTNYSVQHIKCHMPKLEYLDLTGTSVTADIMEWFASVRPTVTVVS